MMGPVTAVNTCFQKAFDWKGRASCAEYWWFVLFAFLSYAAAIALSIAVEFPVFPLLVLLLIVPSFGVAVRRLHDANLNGAWLLLSIVPLGGFVVLIFLLRPSDLVANQYGQPYRG